MSRSIFLDVCNIGSFGEAVSQTQICRNIWTPIVACLDDGKFSPCLRRNPPSLSNFFLSGNIMDVLLFQGG